MRDELDAFAYLLASPLLLVMPILVTLCAALPLSEELSHRFASQCALRSGRGIYLTSRVLIGSLMATVPFVVSTLFAAWLAFGWVPSATSAIAPELYDLTDREARASWTERATGTQLIGDDPTMFLVAYALWVGLAAFCIASIGQWALLRIEQRFLALATPFVVYIAATLGAALVGRPQLGIAYAIFPFGLAQSPPSHAAAPACR